jgi:predicted DNA-binding WGR domain protein
MIASGGVQFQIKQFLWYKNEAENSDKIWGYVDVDGKIYNFWGKRADLDGKKKLTFKRWLGRWGEAEVQDKAREKRRKGYKDVDSQRTADGEYPGIEGCYQGFVKSFKNQLMMARLTGNVMGEEV